MPEAVRSQTFHHHRSARLCPGEDLEVGGSSLDHWHLDPGPQGGLGKSDRQAMYQVGIPPLESGIGGHGDLDE